MACLPDGGQEEGEGAEGGGWASQEELVGWGVLPQGLQLGGDEGQGGLEGQPRWRVQIFRPQLGGGHRWGMWGYCGGSGWEGGG